MENLEVKTETNQMKSKKQITFDMFFRIKNEEIQKPDNDIDENNQNRLNLSNKDTISVGKDVILDEKSKENDIDASKIREKLIKQRDKEIVELKSNLNKQFENEISSLEETEKQEIQNTIVLFTNIYKSWKNLQNSFSQNDFNAENSIMKQNQDLFEKIQEVKAKLLNFSASMKDKYQLLLDPIYNDEFLDIFEDNDLLELRKQYENQKENEIQRITEIQIKELNREYQMRLQGSNNTKTDDIFKPIIPRYKM